MLDDIDVRVIESNDDTNEEDNKKSSLVMTPQQTFTLPGPDSNPGQPGET